MILPVILSGGAGTRLWPLSTREKPKQFWNFLSKQSLLQETFKRLTLIHQADAPILIANRNHEDLITKQLTEINAEVSALILEPFGKNTAPAIAIAALSALETGNDPILFVLPADHLITQRESFCHAVNVAQQGAQLDYLVTFGIIPSRPETGYGYIKAKDKISSEADLLLVEQFVEKPSLETAKAYQQSGEYFWNSGMFMFKASVFLNELQRFRPDIFTACQETYTHSKKENRTCYLNPDYFNQSPSDSIDYAVMEKTDRAAVLPVDFGWSDVGSWPSLFELTQKDSEENATSGQVTTKQTTNSYLRADHRQLITIGVQDLIIIETENAVLVAHKDHCHEIKSLIQK